MRRMKKILLILVAAVLVLPSFPTTALTNDDKSKENAPAEDAVISSKDEVVYATLSANGDKQEIYVVNTLDVDKEGKVTDHGAYSSLKNLTNLSEIEQVDNVVQFTATEGKFFYQGNMDKEPLPWDIVISYFLDGEKIPAEELAGKDGHVEIQIETSANEMVNPVFFENYLLQISLPLDTNIFTNIKAQDGMVANAGKNKQVTFTVMPEQEGALVVEADVDGFELAGIDITGVPSSMSIDAPDVDEMTGDMKTLSDAITALNSGVAELSSGVSNLNSGVKDLRAGSKQYKDGISELDAGSSGLVNGSKDIEEALETMNESFANVEEIDLSEMEQLVSGLNKMKNGLGETVNLLETLKVNFNNAYSNLDEAMEAIPNYEIPADELEGLESSNADQEVVRKLVETYKASRTAKGTYTEVKQGFDAVDVTLQGVVNGLSEIETNLNTMVDKVSSSLKEMNGIGGIVQLQEGIAALASNYKVFHAGLVDYANGVGQLSSAYQDVHAGIVGLSEGTKELETGTHELHNGTSELHEATSDLPDQMTNEIDQMISEYDKSDFDVVSFVSTENKNVNSVQFVLKTEAIKYAEPETTEELVEEEKGFWDRFLDLFR